MHEEATTTTTTAAATAATSANKLSNSSLINISNNSLNATTNITVAIVSASPQTHQHLSHQQVGTATVLAEMHPSPSSSSTQLTPIHTIQSGQHVAILPVGTHQTATKIIINNNSIQTSLPTPSQSPSHHQQQQQHHHHQHHHHAHLQQQISQHSDNNNLSKALIPNLSNNNNSSSSNNNNNKTNVIVSTNQIPVDAVSTSNAAATTTTSTQYHTTQLIIATTTVPVSEARHIIDATTGATVVTQADNLCEVTTLQNVVPNITTSSSTIDTTDHQVHHREAEPETSSASILHVASSSGSNLVETVSDGGVEGAVGGSRSTTGSTSGDNMVEFDIQDLNNCSTDETNEANIMSFTYGIAVGWPSISLPLLQSSNSPLPSGPISLFVASWIGSMTCVGGAFGTIFYGWLVNKAGRKLTLLSASVPLNICWLLIEYGETVFVLLIARFLSGFAGSVIFVTIPVIVSEIANKTIRGSLGSLMILTINAGIVTSYVICAYTSYFTVPWITIGLSLIFLMGYSIVPETPKFLMISNKTEAALNSLKLFRGDPNVSSEDLLKYSIQLGGTEGTQNKLKCSDFCEPAAKKGIIIGLILMQIPIFSGLFTMANYYQTIFHEAGSTLPPEVSSIIVASIQFMGAYSATMTIEKAGRKRLIVISGYLSALCLSAVGAFTLLQEYNFDLSSFMWFPLLCLSLLVFIAANGAASVPFVVLGEIFSQNVRGTLISVAMFSNWAGLFVTVLVFPYMLLHLKLYGTLWVFAVLEIVLVTAVSVLMPETKGLSIEQIVGILNK